MGVRISKFDSAHLEKFLIANSPTYFEDGDANSNSSGLQIASKLNPIGWLYCSKSYSSHSISESGSPELARLEFILDGQCIFNNNVECEYASCSNKCRMR